MSDAAPAPGFPFKMLGLNTRRHTRQWAYQAPGSAALSGAGYEIGFPCPELLRLEPSSAVMCRVVLLPRPSQQSKSTISNVTRPPKSFFSSSSLCRGPISAQRTSLRPADQALNFDLKDFLISPSTHPICCPSSSPDRLTFKTYPRSSMSLNPHHPQHKTAVSRRTIPAFSQVPPCHPSHGHGAARGKTQDAEGAGQPRGYQS